MTSTIDAAAGQDAPSGVAAFRQWFKNNENRAYAVLMLIPSLILVAIFVYGFIGQAIYTSMTDWGVDPAKPPLAENVEKTFIGLQNYQDLMTDLGEAAFRVSMVNNFFFTVLFVVGCVVIGLGLALLLDQKIVGEGIFRTIFLYPMSLSFIVTGTIWRWMFQPTGGINILPETLLGVEAIQFSWISSRDIWLPFQWADVPMYITYAGLAILGFLVVRYALKQEWRSAGFAGAAAAVVGLIFFAGLWDMLWLPLDQPDVEPFSAPKGFNAALLGIIIAAIWQMSGYTMAMFLAGIRGIPEELREAARVDGANELQIYWLVVLPQLKPIMLSAMIILGHISLKIFDLVFAMAGPDNSRTVVPGILVYTKGFRGNEFAKAAAIAVIMLFFVAIIIIPYLWSQLSNPRDE